MTYRDEGGISLTGDGVDQMNGVSEPTEVNDSPIEGVLTVGAMIHGYKDIAAAASLAGLSLELRLRNQRYQRR